MDCMTWWTGLDDTVDCTMQWTARRAGRPHDAVDCTTQWTARCARWTVFRCFKSSCINVDFLYVFLMYAFVYLLTCTCRLMDWQADQLLSSISVYLWHERSYAFLKLLTDSVFTTSAGRLTVPAVDHRPLSGWIRISLCPVLICLCSISSRVLWLHNDCQLIWRTVYNLSVLSPSVLSTGWVAP